MDNLGKGERGEKKNLNNVETGKVTVKIGEMRTVWRKRKRWR